MSSWDGTRWLDQHEQRPVETPTRHRWTDRLATLVIVAGMALAVVPIETTSASSRQISLSPSSGPPGTRVTVSGSSFRPMRRVQLTWDGAFAWMPTASVNRDGRFSVSFIVRATAAAGSHRIAVRTVLRSAVKVVTRSSQLGPALAAGVFRVRSAPVATPTAGPGDGFVYRVGTKLMLDGQPFRFTGFNIYHANSRNNCAATMGTGPALGTALTSIGSGAEVFRSWFFQRLATANGVRDWAAFDHTLAVARARGVKVIVTLANQWGSCEITGVPVYKAVDWYRDGYRMTIDPESTVTYREWVREVVTRYRNDATVAMWQMINEAEVMDADRTACGSASLLRDFAADIGGLIKSIDSKHLVSLGTMGGGQCGAVWEEYAMVHGIPEIDVCEYHDYAPDAMPGDQWNGLQKRIDQCRTLGKPIFVGEVGVRPSDVGGTLADRARVIDAKMTAQFSAGVAGILVWAWFNEGSTTDNYDIGPADPIIDLLQSY